MTAVDDLMRDAGAYYCIECGKCTTVCPIANADPEFAPRLIVVKAMAGIANVALEPDIWRCMTCEICSEMCPYNVLYSEFIRGLRAEAASMGIVSVCSQHDLMQTMMRMMATPGIEQNRLGWVTPDLKIADKGEVFYFTGCLPQMSTIFGDREDLNLIGIAQSAVAIFNRAGITPVVSNQEVCCGHDLNWTGDEVNFEKLMRINLDLIKKSGAAKVVFTCAECLRTFEIDYQDIAGDLDYELLHISEFVDDLVAEGKIEFDGVEEKVTYHDPCRLGRHLGIYDAPRNVIGAIEGMDLIEMERTREKSACCGVSAWLTCDSIAKEMQLARMVEAVGTGSKKLITSCPKCQIHLRCAISEEMPIEREKADIPIEDFTILVANSIKTGA